MCGGMTWWDGVVGWRGGMVCGGMVWWDDVVG